MNAAAWRRREESATCAAAVLAVSLVAPAARADLAASTPTPVGPVAAPAAIAPAVEPAPARRLVWDAAWPRVSILEYGTMAASLEAHAFIQFRMQLPADPRWSGGILFDDAVRSAFRLHTASGRAAADDTGSWLMRGVIAELVVATVVPPAVDHMNLSVFWQLALIDTEAQLFAGLTQRTLMFIAQRARPSFTACRASLAYGDCGGEVGSFPSGHTSTAVAAAATSCAHHLNLPLYGGGAPDVAACITSLTAATAVGVMRIMGDDHWATDVILGGSIGFFYGFGLPTLLHYHAILPSIESRHVRAALVPAADAGSIGARLVGVF